MTPREFRRARQFRSPLGLRRQSASGDGAFARERELQAFEDRCPHESGVATSIEPILKGLNHPAQRCRDNGAATLGDEAHKFSPTL